MIHFIGIMFCIVGTIVIVVGIIAGIILTIQNHKANKGFGDPLWNSEVDLTPEQYNTNKESHHIDVFIKDD